MAQCDSCGAAIKAGTAFCVACGNRVAPARPICSACGGELQTGVRFCPSCGQGVVTGQSGAQPTVQAPPARATRPTPTAPVASAPVPKPPLATASLASGGRSRIKPLALVAVAVAALAVVAIGLVVISGHHKAAASRGLSTVSPPSVAVMTTVAGRAGVQGSADGTGAAARFNGAASITSDASGQLYVTDSGNDTVRKIAPDGVVTTIAGKAGVRGSADGTGAAASFDQPYGITCDASGDLYIADTGNNLVRKITPDGVVTTVAGQAGAGDEGDDKDGKGAAATLGIPSGIAHDASGNLYVEDLLNSLTRKITPDGVVTTIAGHRPADGSGSASSYSAPVGITCDASGNIYAFNDTACTIRKITPGGVVTTFAGKAGVQGTADGIGAAARFDWPSGMTCDASGTLYVADTQNGNIRKITPSGVVTTIAVKAGVGTDDFRTAASDGGPMGIVCDSHGNLYFTTDDTVCKITWSN